MNYRVRYIPEAETWAIDHHAWLRTGDRRHHFDGPWLQVTTRPNEAAAWRYIHEVQARQQALNEAGCPTFIHRKIHRNERDIPATSTRSSQANEGSLSTCPG